MQTNCRVKLTTNTNLKSEKNPSTSKHVWVSRKTRSKKSAPVVLDTSHIPWISESGEDYRDLSTPTEISTIPSRKS